MVPYVVLGHHEYDVRELNLEPLSYSKSSMDLQEGTDMERVQPTTAIFC